MGSLDIILSIAELLLANSDDDQDKEYYTSGKGFWCGILVSFRF